MYEEINFLSGKHVTEILKEREVDSSLIAKIEWLQDQVWRFQFDSPFPSFCASPGHILIANKYLSDPEVRSVYTKVFEMVGEIDCYVSLVKKMKKHARGDFNLVHFVENEKPFIEMKGYWNPFFNCMPLGDFLEYGESGMDHLIMNDHGCTKTENTKAFMINIALAQSFGIVAARSCTMTPFGRVDLCVKDRSDSSDNTSFIKKATARINNLACDIARLGKNERGLFLMNQDSFGKNNNVSAAEKAKSVLGVTELKNVLILVNPDNDFSEEPQNITNKSNTAKNDISLGSLLGVFFLGLLFGK